MSKQLLLIDTELSAQQFKDVCPLNADKYEAVNSLVNYMGSLAGGLQMADMKAKVGAVQSVARITFSGAPTAAQQCYIGNITITARASGATGYEFNIGGNVSATATNMANMINAQYPGVLTAVANVVAGRVDITAVIPGLSGNYIGISAGNLSNTTLTSSFAGGSDGTEYDLDLR